MCVLNQIRKTLAKNTALYPIDQFESCHVQKAFFTLNQKSI